MKTLSKFCLISAFLFAAFCYNSNCQIKVFSNNYVGINYNSTPSSRFVINSGGQAGYQAYIFNPSISTSGAALLTLSDKGTGTSSHIFGHYSSAFIGSSDYLYGTKSVAYSSTVYSTGRTYGVYGSAGNGATGYNYAVYGSLVGTNNGAAVFGAINGLGDVSVPGQYAGYFRGNVKCENIMYATAFTVQSDEKYKTNITDLDTDKSLNDISKIIPKKYNLKQIEVVQNAGDTTSVTKYFNETDQLFTKTKYGVLAQDLQKIFPDLVYQDGDGNLSVDYIGLIPITIKALQAQQNKIALLEEKIAVMTQQLEELAKH